MELFGDALPKGYAGLVYGLIAVHILAFVVWLVMLALPKKHFKVATD